MTKENKTYTRPETGLRSIVHMIDKVLHTYKEFTLHIGDRPFGSSEFNKFRNDRAEVSPTLGGHRRKPQDVSFATLKNYGVVRIIAERVEEKVVDSWYNSCSYRLPNGKIISEYEAETVMNILGGDDVLDGEWIKGELVSVKIYTYVFDINRLAELTTLAATLHTFLDE